MLIRAQNHFEQAVQEVELRQTEAVEWLKVDTELVSVQGTWLWKMFLASQLA